MSESSKLDSVKLKLQKAKELITEYQNLAKNAINSNDYAKYYNKLQLEKRSFDFYKNIHSKLLEFYTLLCSSDEKDFKSLFDLKDKCKQTNNKYAITFGDILKVLNISRNDSQMILNLLYELYIVDYGTKPENVYICWKDLSNIINNYADTRNMQKILYTYYMEIQDSYEIIVDSILRHKDRIKGNVYSYNINTEYIGEKKDQIISNQKKRIGKLKIEIEDLIKDKEIIAIRNSTLHNTILKLTPDNKIQHTPHDFTKYVIPIDEFYDHTEPEFIDLPIPQEFTSILNLNTQSNRIEHILEPLTPTSNSESDDTDNDSIVYDNDSGEISDNSDDS
jgi:hypothetical protein